jgi:AcrR family transcriptional regulator
MTVQVSVGRRERKKTQTRAALRAAAVRLVDQRGLDAVTVEDVTEEADVSARTFFNYFSSKEEALTAPDPDRLARLRAQLVARPSREHPLRALRAVLVADTSEHAPNRDEWLAQLSVLKRDPRLMAALAGSWIALEGELAAGLTDRLTPGEELRAQVAAGAAVAIFRVALRRWKTDAQPPLADLVGAAFDELHHVVEKQTP